MSSARKHSMSSILSPRYLRKEIYTNIARIVIALNPFENIDIYTPKHVDIYAQAQDPAQFPPHVYGVGAEAFQGEEDWGI
jgi:myosin heavy subunit